LETKHAYGRRARNARAFQRDCKLSRIGPLQRRPPRHQRRPFRRVTVELRAFELRHVLPLAGGSLCGPTPERRDGGSLKNVAEGGDSEWGWGSPRAFAETNTLARRFSASRRRRPRMTTLQPRALAVPVPPQRADLSQGSDYWERSLDCIASLLNARLTTRPDSTSNRAMRAESGRHTSGAAAATSSLGSPRVTPRRQ